MADSSVAVTPGAGSNIDTRTNATGDHRQVVVFGHPSATDSVAEVLGSDPLSNTEGVVVRDPYTTNIVSGLRDVRIQSIVDGTVTVGDITRVKNVVDGTLTTITRVDRVMNLVDGTLTIENLTRIRNVVDGTLSTVARVSNVVDGTLTTITGIDRVRNLIDGTITTVTSLGTATRVDRVMNVVDGTLTTLTRADRVMNLIDGTISTVTFLGTAQRLQNLVDGTLTTVTGVDRVRNVIDGTLTTITGIDRVRNVVDGTISLISMAQRVNNVVDGTLSMVQRINNVVDGTLSLVSMVQRVNNLVNGTVSIQFAGVAPVTPNSGIPAVNIYSTTNIFTVAGSVSGNYPSGFTLVAPSANASFKVFAFSLQTTGIVSCVARFTNGGGTPTEFFRGLVTANQTASAPIGANLAVQPPGFLFATGTSTTLALLRDSDTLVHYSVSYIKESA